MRKKLTGKICKFLVFSKTRVVLFIVKLSILIRMFSTDFVVIANKEKTGFARVIFLIFAIIIGRIYMGRIE